MLLTVAARAFAGFWQGMVWAVFDPRGDPKCQLLVETKTDSSLTSTAFPEVKWGLKGNISHSGALLHPNTSR